MAAGDAGRGAGWGVSRDGVRLGLSGARRGRRTRPGWEEDMRPRRTPQRRARAVCTVAAVVALSLLPWGAASAVLDPGVPSHTAPRGHADRADRAGLGGRTAASTAATTTGTTAGTTAGTATEGQAARADGRATLGDDRGPGRKGAPVPASGADLHGADDVPDSRAGRLLQAAATWDLDPRLLEPTPIDSAETASARKALARLDVRVPKVLDRYELRLSLARAARERAAEAQRSLEQAREEAAAAARRYRADRALLVALVTDDYQTGSLGTAQLVMSANDPDDLFSGMTVLDQLSDSQAGVVLATERSLVLLNAAVERVEVLTEVTARRFEVAQAALASAQAARRQVLADVMATEKLLRRSVIADQIVALQLAQERLLEQASAFGTAAAADGKVFFPLPADSGYVDNNNWGHQSGLWASVHTGDDFSVGCGTPVLAATSGTIEISTAESWSGAWLVKVSQGPGELTTWYAHMQALNVTDGQQVRAGQQIGLVGAEGNATGCHLHFEVHPVGGSIYEDNIDPVAWLVAVGAYYGSPPPKPPGTVVVVAPPATSTDEDADGKQGKGDDGKQGTDDGRNGGKDGAADGDGRGGTGDGDGSGGEAPVPPWTQPDDSEAGTDGGTGGATDGGTGPIEPEPTGVPDAGPATG